MSTTFDMLYMLARKMEEHQPDNSSRGGTAVSEGYKKYRQYPNPGNRVTMLDDEGELFPPDSEEHDYETSEEDPFEGLNTRMTQAMNHSKERRTTALCAAKQATSLGSAPIEKPSVLGRRS